MRKFSLIVALWVNASAVEAQCPGRPPPPMECVRVVCVAGDAAWDYRPLPAGTVCQGTGLCDGRMTCVLPQPNQEPLAIPGDEINTLIGFFLKDSMFSVDATGNSPPLITGHHTECTDPPGPIPIYCWEVAETHHSYIKFSDSLKTFYASETNGQLNDYAFPDIGPFCGALGVCAEINQIHGDLGDVRVLFGQAASGAYAHLIIPMQSPSSTVIIDSGAPDLELTNIHLSVYLTLLPVSNGVGLGAIGVSDVKAVFDFNSNLNNFPDWLVDCLSHQQWDPGEREEQCPTGLPRPGSTKGAPSRSPRPSRRTLSGRTANSRDSRQSIT